MRGDKKSPGSKLWRRFGAFVQTSRGRRLCFLAITSRLHSSRIVIFTEKARGVSLIGYVFERMKSEQQDTKRATAEQYWICLQRYLQFDDPESKWERQLQLAIKHATNKRIKMKQAERLPLADQQVYFTETFGAVTESRRQVSTVFNTILGLQDIDTFAPLAFDAWLTSYDRPVEMVEATAESFFAAQIKEIAASRSLTASQTAWLMHCAQAAPDWTVLLEEGPWSDDNIRQFIVDFMLAADLTSVKSGSDILSASEKFKSSLLDVRGNLELPAQFFPRLILLVEGATETILMPHFARLLGRDFDRLAVLIVGTGGANQTSRKYLLLRDVTNLPIYAVLDADATEQVEVISDMLRESDRLHVWQAGDIEDTFAVHVFLPQINHYVAGRGGEPLIASELPPGERRTVMLDRAFRKRGLGDFDKIGFARSIVDRLTDPGEVPRDATAVIEDIANLARKS